MMMNITGFIITLLVLFPLSESRQRIRCPLSCACDKDAKNPQEVGVTCEDKRTWSGLPILPLNTTYLRMKNSNMTVLRSAVDSNSGGRYLRKLLLMNMNISTIVVDVFRNFNGLEDLLLQYNTLSTIPSGTFQNIPQLLDLTLGDNHLTTIPSDNICFLTHLQVLNITGNRITSAKFDDCFLQLRNLSRLEFSGNPIREIKPGDFDSLRNSNISTLYLTKLELTAISPDTFKHLPRLKLLNLEQNNLTSLDSRMFQYIPRLTSLIIGRNQFNRIPDVSGLFFLEYLDLERNNIKNNSLGINFKNSAQLTNLTFSNNHLGALTNTSFSNMSSSAEVKRLDLHDCKLQKIASDAFLPLKYLNVLALDANYIHADLLQRALYGLRCANNLTQLNLDNSRLMELSSMTFQYLENTSLTSLSARYCNIKIITSGTFQHLTKLQYVSLENNVIKNIEENAFLNVNELLTLDISRNRLQYISDANSVKLGNLKQLVLSHNNIASTSRLTPDSLKGYDQLEELTLQSNQIITITSNVFIHASNLRSLVLSYNQIRTLDKCAFGGLNKLETLDIKHNYINAIDVDIFKQTPALTHLDLSYNPDLISVIKGGIADLFRPLQNLDTIQLISIGTQDLPDSLLSNLTRLSIVSFSSNHMSKLDPRLLQDQPNITVLTIKRNNIPTISESAIGHMDNLQQLDVSNNTFHCDCNLQWFTDWIRSGFVYVRNLENVRCSTPTEKSGLKLEDVSLDRQCMSLLFYYVYWSALFVYMWIVVLLAMVYRLRWYIR